MTDVLPVRNIYGLHSYIVVHTRDMAIDMARQYPAHSGKIHRLLADMFNGPLIFDYITVRRKKKQTIPEINDAWINYIRVELDRVLVSNATA